MSSRDGRETILNESMSLADCYYCETKVENRTELNFPYGLLAMAVALRIETFVRSYETDIAANTDSTKTKEAATHNTNIVRIKCTHTHTYIRMRNKNLKKNSTKIQKKHKRFKKNKQKFKFLKNV